MKNRDQAPLAEQDPTLLFEEYLSAMDAGESVDEDVLARRAGRRAPELQRRLQVYRALQELSNTLQPDSDAHIEAIQESQPADAAILELGRFRELVQIGHGGSSRVLLAYDPKLARHVALKVFSPREIGVRDARSWMQNEGRLLARLEHPGVVRVFELDEADGHAYIAMEYVRGPSLRSVLDRLRERATGEAGDGTTSMDSSSSTTTAAKDNGTRHENGRARTDGFDRPGEGGEEIAQAWTRASARALASLPARVRLAAKLARSLQYCHEAGVVHRDIKPGNILLVEREEPKLIDFGLAHSGTDEASQNQVTQRLVGTPAYLSPEQVDDSRTGASLASDQFSLGTLLYELFTLTNPFQKETRDDTLTAISRAAPPPLRKFDPAIPSDLERIVLHCLERQPRNRYASIGALADDLEAFLGWRAISLQPPSPIKLARLWIARHRRDVVLTGSGFLLMSVILVGLWIIEGRARRQRFSEQLLGERTVVDSLDTPPAFEVEFSRLDALRETARDIDRESVAMFLDRNQRQGALAAIDACSQRLAKVLEAKWKGFSKLDRFHYREAAKKLMVDWGTVLGQDLLICPDCQYNVRDRQRGRVDLPALESGQSMHVLAYEFESNNPMLCTLTPIEFQHGVTAGAYRCQILDAGGTLLKEVDFESCIADERRVLELCAPLPRIRGAMARVEKTTVRLGPTTKEVGPLWVSKLPVRWKDLQLAFEPARMDQLKSLAEGTFARKYEPTDPAILEYQDAQAFASRVGARIPKLEELIAAWKSSEVETPGAESIVDGEIVTGPAKDDERWAARYLARNPKPGAREPLFPMQKEFGSLMRGKGAGGSQQGYTFRLAFSDHPFVDAK